MLVHVPYSNIKHNSVRMKASKNQQNFMLFTSFLYCLINHNNNKNKSNLWEVHMYHM